MQSGRHHNPDLGDPVLEMLPTRRQLVSQHGHAARTQRKVVGNVCGHQVDSTWVTLVANLVREVCSFAPAVLPQNRNTNSPEGMGWPLHKGIWGRGRACQNCSVKGNEFPGPRRLLASARSAAKVRVVPAGVTRFFSHRLRLEQHSRC